ncbi:hypothetical protein VNI00_008245 [Paramarasmius palmivorus]|uniref:Histone H1 n=1 Tax=Paramarasmius palmivorus TaxID=297713 RepID=A0AAW0CUS4_9AGAR
MSDKASSPAPAEAAPVSTSKPASKAATETKKPASRARKATTATTAATKKAAAKPKTTKSTTTKASKSKTPAAHPSWKDIVKECIIANKEDSRIGVSRATIKKYAEDKYKLEFNPTNTYNLSRAISNGADSGIFVLPKGPSGRVKLAPKNKTPETKENSTPAPAKAAKKTSATTKKSTATTTKAAPKKATATAATKKSATTTTKKAAPAAKKAIAGKPKAATAASKTKKTTTASKRGTAKKAATGTTATTKAKTAAKKATTTTTKKAAAAPAKKAAAGGTRSRVKPSIRLRQSSQPNPVSFPPPQTTLHPDDASSKIFNAIAKALLSVDNRAMTIKDLSEMVVHFGYVSQNASAASQAILTYIRTHYQRCKDQQDLPLLFKFPMSGTPTDDDLVPALHSTSGGAHVESCSPGRLTNFRRGTTVWYLSRVTGAPCPFARANIRLSDYALPSHDVDKPSQHKSKPHHHREPVQCGQKRKRRSTRECVLKQQHQPTRSPSPLSPMSSEADFDTDSDSDRSSSSDDSSSDDDDQLSDQPPPVRVKLTLKLPPLAQVMAGNRSNKQVVDHYKGPDQSLQGPEPQQTQNQQLHEPCLPPYPRRSISIPPYTPSADYPAYPSLFHHSIPHPHHSEPSTSYRRSPSIPYSVASPPPDSDVDEDEDKEQGHIDTDSPSPRASVSFDDIDCDDDEDDDEYNVDMDRDGEDADFSSSDWEDDSDMESEQEASTWDSPGPRSPSAPPLSSSMPAYIAVKEEPTDVQGLLDRWEDVLDHDLDATVKVKAEPDLELPAFDGWGSSSSSASPPRIKQEEQDSELSLSFEFSGPTFSNWRNLEDPVSPTSPSGPSHSDFLHTEKEPSLPADPTITQSLASLIHQMSFTPSPPTSGTGFQSFALPKSEEISPPCVSPDDTRIRGGTNFGPTDYGKPVQALDIAAFASTSLDAQSHPQSHSFSPSKIISLVPSSQDTLPLSPTEEEIFQEICVNLEWEDAPPSTATIRAERERSPSPLSSCPPSPTIASTPAKKKKAPPVVRRSQRVANKKVRGSMNLS